MLSSIVQAYQCGCQAPSHFALTMPCTRRNPQNQIVTRYQVPNEAHVQAVGGPLGNLVAGLSVVAHFVRLREGVVLGVSQDSQKLRVKYFDEAQDRQYNHFIQIFVRVVLFAYAPMGPNSCSTVLLGP